MDLKRQLEQKTAQLAALREIGRAINAAWDLRDTLELITRKTAEVMGMDSCSIYLLDPEGEFLVLEATTGLAPEAVGRARLRLGEGLTGWAAQQGDAMNVQTRAYHEFAPDEVELLSLIADLAAGALEKAMLYERMQRRIEELTTLAEVSRTVTAPLYLDEMLGLIVDMAARVMQAKACSLMLLDEEEVLILRAAHGLGPAYRNHPPIPVGEGVAGWVAEAGEPVVVADVRSDPRYRYPEVARQEGLCSLLCVPLEMHHRVKNNLQTVALLLRLQMAQGDDLDPQEALRESINRVLSIAAVHEMLSEKGFRLVDVREVLRRVAQTVVQNHPHPDQDVRVEVVGDEITLPSRSATALALAVNELVQNGLKHAFVGRDTGRITVSLRRRGPGFEVEVADDGVGLPPEGPPSHSLGLQIVETLVRQDLGGELRFERSPKGTRAVITVEDMERLSR